MNLQFNSRFSLGAISFLAQTLQIFFLFKSQGTEQLTSFFKIWPSLLSRHTSKFSSSSHSPRSSIRSCFIVTLAVLPGKLSRNNNLKHMLKFKMNYFLNEIYCNNLQMTGILEVFPMFITSSSYLQAWAYQS